MTPAAPILDPSTVRFERLLPGPIERVWEFLANPRGHPQQVEPAAPPS